MLNTRTMARRRHCPILVAVVASVFLFQARGVGQTLPWNWGWSGGGAATDDWSPEAFADFLGSGHPPHPAVVRVIAPESGGTAMGSGVLVDVNDAQGLVLTNWHVIRGAKSAVLVQFPDGFQSAGRVIRHDEPWDLAAIVIWRPRAAPVPIAVAPPVIGEPLTINGYGKGPFRSEAGACTQYLAPGTGYPLEFVELQAQARQGDSGGPILNARGEVAGILFGRADGRTIGACSTRVRTFLASVGSRGVSPGEEVSRAAGPSPPPPAALVRQPDPPGAAAGPEITAPLAAGPMPAIPEPPSADEVAPGPLPSPVPAATAPGPAPTPLGAPPPAWGDLPEGRPVGGTVEELLDPRRNARALVVAAAGVLLTIVGLKTIFGGRRARHLRQHAAVGYEFD